MSPFKRIRARLRDVAGDEHLAAVDLLDDDGRVRLLDELRRRFVNWSRNCIRRQPRRLHVVQQRQRDLSVRPHHDVRRHVLVAPEHDRQHVVGADDVVRPAAATDAAAAAGVVRRPVTLARPACCAPTGTTTDGSQRRTRSARNLVQVHCPTPTQLSSSLPVLLERQLTIVLPQEVQEPLVVARIPC